MRRSLTLALTGCLLALAVAPAGAQAVTFVTPHGRALNGQWQRWADESKMPTITGRVTTEPLSWCGIPGVSLPGGCSAYGAPWQIAADGRDSLYFELGHEFDAKYLTGADRARFARMWGVSGPWVDSSRSLAQGEEDGIMVDFAAAYAFCAEGQGEPAASRGAVHGFGFTASWAPAVSVVSLRPTCRLIAAIA